MDRMSRRVIHFDIRHLDLVRDALKESHFTDANWFDLGLELKLPYPDLASIRAKWSNDPSQCLLECLNLWLMSVSTCTWETLAIALERMNQNATAQHIRKTYGDPASQILQYYSDRLSQVSLTGSCIQLLYTKGLINEETQRKIERCGGSLSDSLRELMITVSEDHSKLRSLGDILLKLGETKSVAQEMINDCGEFLQLSHVTSCTVSQIASRPLSNVFHVDPDEYDLVNASFPAALSQPTARTIGSSSVIPTASVRRSESSIRASFARMIFKVSKAIVKKSPPLGDLKTLVSLYKRNLNDKLDDCDSVSGVVSLIQEECNIADIELLQTVVEELNVTEAKRYIEQYKTTLENDSVIIGTIIPSPLSPGTAATDGDPASQILQHYSDRISQVSLTDSCIQLLYTEGLINEETQRKIERCGGSLSDSLRELMITVSEDHSKLRSLGNILLKLEETKSVAQEMIKDCDEVIPRHVTAAVTSNVRNPYQVAVSMPLTVRPHAPVDSHPGLPVPDTLGTNTSEAQPTATITSSLDTGDMNIVLKTLKESFFDFSEWKNLGLALGLHITTLNLIDSDHLLNTIKAWLECRDDVGEGGATWQNLINAVKSVGNIAAAGKICKSLK